MKKLVFLLIVAILMAACTTATPTEPPAPAQPTLLTDSLGEAADLVPTDAEVKSALDAIGTGKIGVIPCTMGSEYHSTVANSALARARSWVSLPKSPILKRKPKRKSLRLRTLARLAQK